LSHEQVVGPFTTIAAGRMLKQGKMGGGIRDRLEVVPVGEVAGINERDRGFDQREAVLTPIPLLDREGYRAECLDVFDLKGKVLKGSIHQVEESRCSGHRCFSDLHTVGEIEESSLKPAITTESLMEEVAPYAIDEITINVDNKVVRERAAHVVSLYKAAIGDEVGKVCTHPVLEGGHARRRRQTQCHEIAKMDCSKTGQQPMQRFRMTQVKGVVQDMWSEWLVHRQAHGVML